ncbi:MAG: diguanylate cyclase [Ruminococcus sp.]|nr:diguanylate cyclase [Ruminococcus sp.]
MRLTYSILFLILIIALLICSVLARRSDRPTRNSVSFLEAALIPPVLGNLFIVGTSMRITALIGCYLYYLGMDLVLYALVNFTNAYCRSKGSTAHKPTVMYVMLAADAVQMILNPIFGHAFSIKEVIVEGAPYYKLVPYWGQAIHRIVDYTVFFSVILIFVIFTVKAPKINRERFAVLLATMAGVGLLQTYNIFFQYAIDRSMLGYGVFGVVIYFFAIHYRPLRLLDSVLSNIVSGLSDAFYVFDSNGSCIWANDQGCRLAGIEDNNYEAITGKLMEKFGDSGNPDEHITKRRIGEGADACYYVFEENYVKDSKGRVDGSYLRVQDITEEERKIRARDEQIGQISQEAYRDPLTGVGSKAAYTKKVGELNRIIAEEEPEFAVIMVDMNNLKYINDDYGHKAGDLYIRGCCHLICEFFKHSPVFRIGGDEFTAILQGQDYENRVQITAGLREAYKNAYEQEDAEPWLRYSAAVGLAEYASDDNAFELVFKRADKAMYEEKKEFKKKYGSYR